MDWIFSTLLSNAVLAAIPAGAAVVVWRRWGKPALVHALWLLALVKLVTPPVFEVRIPVLSPEAKVAPAYVTQVPAHRLALPESLPPINVNIDAPLYPEATPGPTRMSAPLITAAATSIPWGAILMTVWLTGAAVVAAVAIRAILSFNRALRFGRTADRATLARGRRIAIDLGLRRCPDVRFLNGAVSPMLWAWLGRARLYLPVDLWARLDDAQRDALLAHELAHFARRDHWVRYLELFAGVIYWWHPLVWVGRRQLREAEEQCCDAWVVQALPAQNRRAYATALVDAVDYLAAAGAPAGRQMSLASGAVSVSAKELKRRLVMIMKATQARRLSLLGRIGVIAAGLAVLPMVPRLATADEPGGRGTTTADGKREKTLNGSVMGVDGTTIVLSVGEAGREIRVPTDGGTTLTIDGAAAKVSDLKNGMFVAARQVDGLTTRVEARAGRGMARFAGADGERKVEGAGDGERKVEGARDGGRPKEGARDGDRPKEGARDGDRPKEGVRDGERRADGPRDGDRPKEGARDGDRPREGTRDGDRPKEGPRDADRPREGARDGDRRPAEGERRADAARMADVRLRIGTPRGRVASVDGTKVMLVGGEGRAGFEVATDDKTRVWVDGKPGTLADVKPGMLLMGRTVEGVTTEIDARTTGREVRREGGAERGAGDRDRAEGAERKGDAR
ncbi:MAG TPA: M56 family metallopeptidase [Tepidisphaeraceae bacterium]|nr:M56 family metallopeptidase [Tepidisphaeraceae bacterium]